jgi:predicted nucleic acid-binding protein
VKTVLLDTDILIEVLRQRDAAILAQWRRITGGAEPVVYTPVTTAELWHGLRPGEDTAVREVLDTLICVPLNDEIGRRAGGYLRQFHRSHGVDIGDALIAAAAAVHGCALWTHNRKHYPMEDIELV